MTDTLEVTTSGEFPVIDAGLDNKISCISKDATIKGEITSPFSDASWVFTPTMETTFIGNSANLKVSESGEYVFRVRDRECISFDTLQIDSCNLLLKDTTFAICANVNSNPPSFSTYDLNGLENYILDGNTASLIEWYSDSSFISPMPTPSMTSLEDSIPIYVRVESADGTEIARAKVFPIIHDYVEIDFNDITNTCAGEDTIQISGMSPEGGIFVSTPYLDASGTFVAPKDSGKYEITYSYESSEGCGDSLTKIASVIEIPIRPLVTDLFYCQNVEEIPDFNITFRPDHQLFWYEDSTFLPLDNKPNLTRNVDSLVYFISQKNSLCESAKQPFFVRVDSTPGVREILGESFLCEGFSSVLRTSGLEGSKYFWNLESDSVFSFIDSDKDTLSYNIGRGKVNVDLVEVTEKGCAGDTAFFEAGVDFFPQASILLSTYDTCQMTDTIVVSTNTPNSRDVGEWKVLTPKGDESFWYLDANELLLSLIHI